MGFSPSSKLIYGVQVPDDGWADEDTPSVSYLLHECELDTPEGVETVTSGSYDWGHEATIYLQIARIAWDLEGEGTEVSNLDSWKPSVDLDVSDACQSFCEEHKIPFEPRVYLVSSYG